MNNEYQRSRAKSKKEKGECLRCLNPVELGFSTCSECRNKKTQYRKIRKGRCESCGLEILSGCYCDACKAKRNNHRRQRDEERKSSAVCVSCSSAAVVGKTRCEECLNRLRAWAAQRKNDRLSQSLCVRCGKVEAVNSMCESCYLENISKNHFKSNDYSDILKHVFENQDGICPYTKKKMVLGLTSTLDHIVPKSRGGKNEVQNFQWVYKKGHHDINWMKGAMLEQEFVEAVKELAIIFNENSK